MNKQSIASEWGSIFGLTASDLTDTQLEKISFGKLLEFVEDPRAEKLLIAKLENAEAWEQERIYTVEKELSALENFKITYNDWIRKGCPKKSPVNENSYYYNYNYRQHAIRWSLLDDKNREAEFDTYLRGSYSIINFRDLDLQWGWSKQPEKTKELAVKVLKENGSPHDMNRLLEKIPKEHTKELVPLLFQRKDKSFHVAALSSPHLSDRHIVKALKTWAKIVHNPEIKAKIKISHLNRLPPITRLEVLEKLVYKNLSITTDIQNEEELKQLVFSSMMKYYQRVQNLLKDYKRYTGVKNE